MADIITEMSYYSDKTITLDQLIEKLTELKQQDSEAGKYQVLLHDTGLEFIMELGKFEVKEITLYEWDENGAHPYSEKIVSLSIESRDTDDSDDSRII